MKRRLLTPLLLLTALAAQAQACELEFELRVTPTQVEVALRLPASTKGETALGMSTAWAGAGDLAAKEVQAEGGSLQSGEGPGRWLLKHAGPATLRYRLPLKQLPPGEGQQQVEMYRPQGAPDHFQVFGYGLFLLPEEAQDRPREICLRWKLQEPLTAPLFNSFGHAEPGMAQRFRASAQQLRHAVYAGGEGWRLREQTLPSGGLLQVAVRGSFPNASDRRFTQQAAQLIAAQQRFWRQPGEAAPLPQWLLLTPTFFPSGSYGGTLVTRAAVLHVAANFALDSPSFVKLIAHENLHDWIPSRFGARGPGGQADVPGYWFSEGFTDFFTHRLLLASGVWSLDDYAARMTERLRRYDTAREKTLTAAAIAPIFFSDRAAGEQMYLRGEWLALRFEEQLAQKPGAPTLPALMRALLLPPGHAEKTPAAERLLAALRPHLNAQADDAVRRFVTEGEALPLAEISTGPCLRLESLAETPWTLGFDSGSFKTKKARRVDTEGPAYAAGLRDGMELVFWSVHYGDKTRRVELQAKGEDGKLVDVFYMPAAAKPVMLPAWRPRPGAEEEAACMRWKRLD